MAKYGVTIESKNPSQFTDENASVMQQIGFEIARLQFHQQQQQPTAGGPVDFTESDRQIALAQKYALKVVWPLQQPADWAKQPGASSVPTPEAFAAYAQAVYARYSGNTIYRFEVCNEEFSWEKNASLKTPQNYASVFAATANALRQAGYKGFIDSFGYTNYHSTQEITSFFQGFLATNPKVDAIGAHFYHEGEDPLKTLTGKPSINDLISAIRASGATQHIHLTEFGYRTHCDSEHPSPCNEISPDLQAQYEQSILQALYNDNKHNHAYVYTLEPGQQVMSIYQQGTWLPACTMFQQWIRSH